MVVRFEKCELKIDEIKKEEISSNFFGSHEQKVLELIKQWLVGEPYFTFKTSGSTGQPKTIKIDREKVEYSCKTTMDFLDPTSGFKFALLCLDPHMIGGAMVVFRALYRQLNLMVTAPTSNPWDTISSDQQFDLVSMVPLQVSSGTAEQLNQFDTILVGGADLGVVGFETKANIYATFGMTETVSHFALRKSDSEVYQCIGDAQIRDREDKKLEISGTLTNHKSLITNDLIEFISNNTFKWLGRVDFVINSGGVKVHPEVVERKLAPQMTHPFMVTSLPDKRLGEKVILIQESETNREVDFSALDKYERPRETYSLKQIERTPSGKIDRLKTRQLLLDSFSS